MGLSILCYLVIASLFIFLLWGVGVFIGITSHYGPVPFLIAIALALAGFFTLKSIRTDLTVSATVTMGIFITVFAQGVAQGCIWIFQRLLHMILPKAIESEEDITREE